MDEKIKAVPQEPTLQNVLNENSKLINECIDIGNYICTNLTSNSITNEEKEVSCMIAQAIGQTEKLNKLLDILISIKSNMYC